MKRILVFSDTHGSIDRAAQIVAEVPAIDMIFHLGDNCRDAYALAAETQKRVVSVRGNCDYDPSVPLKELLTVDGARILLVHGHAHHVSSSLLHLSLAAREAQADAVCFGHTHRSLVEYENGVLLLNPGSLSLPRGCAASCGLLEVDRGSVRAQILLSLK